MPKMIARNKRVVTVNVGTSATEVAFYPCFGARAVVLFLTAGASANITTITGQLSKDGITGCGSGLGVAASTGSIRADQAGGAFCIMLPDIGAALTTNQHFMAPYLRILASTATAGGNITFEIYGVYAIEDEAQDLSALG
jgi:hypothetical protein